MDRKRLFTLLYVILIIVVVATCIFLAFWLNSMGSECVLDPLTFYGEKMHQNCYCYADIAP